MLLLPGSLPLDRTTLKASCEGLAELSETAALLQRATVAEYSGSWSDAEREASGDSGDLNDGVALAQLATRLDDEAVSVAIATPIHAALGLTDLTPIDPSKLSLSADESRLLCEASDVHMHEDGVRLHFVDAARWLVTCNRAVDVLTERPDWIIGETLRPNLPRGDHARLVERWMNELQMLLHAHPVNTAREERRLPPVNLVWLWGFNNVRASLPAGVPHAAAERGFVRALRNGDLPAWQATWATVSREILLAKTIILGDSHPHLRVTPTAPSVIARLLSPFKRKATFAEVLTQLQQSR